MRMAVLCRPGGVVAVEDVDLRRRLVVPARARRSTVTLELYRRAAELRGADAGVGPKLPELLERAGLEQVRDDRAPAGVPRR